MVNVSSHVVEVSTLINQSRARPCGEEGVKAPSEVFEAISTASRARPLGEAQTRAVGSDEIVGGVGDTVGDTVGDSVLGAFVELSLVLFVLLPLLPLLLFLLPLPSACRTSSDLSPGRSRRLNILFLLVPLGVLSAFVRAFLSVAEVKYGGVAKSKKTTKLLLKNFMVERQDVCVITESWYQFQLLMPWLFRCSSCV